MLWVYSMTDSSFQKFTLSTIMLIGLFYFFTIRAGHHWGGDFSMYIHLAQNIVEGKGPMDTGYIYNPTCAVLGPKVYPPVFPIILSPVIYFFGQNLFAMKLVIILFFLLFLYTFFLLFKDQVIYSTLICTVILIGFNPFFWSFKDRVLSDIPFLFFLYLFFLFIQRFYCFQGTIIQKVFYAFGIGFLIYLTSSTRSIGVVLVPTLIIVEILKYKKFPVWSILSFVIFILLTLVQQWFWPYTSNYFDQLILSPKYMIHVIFKNMQLYTESLRGIWDNGYSRFITSLIFIFISSFSLFGYLKSFKSKITNYMIFPIIYLVLLLLWPPNEGTRFLIPIIPLYIFFFFIGLDRIGFRKINKKQPQNGYFYGFMILLFFIYGAKYSKLNFNVIKEGPYQKEALELYEFISENSVKDDVFIFRSPRILTLFTGRYASCYHLPSSDRDLWDYMTQIKASYIIIGEKDGDFIKSFIRKYTNNFKKLFNNGLFECYQIQLIDYKTTYFN